VCFFAEEMMEIRDAGATDIERITSIYNEVLLTSTAIFSDKPYSVEDRMRWWSDRCAAGYPVIIAVEEGEVVGFATYGDFRASPGYRNTVEHTVHLREANRGRGVGTALVRELIARARAAGKHVMVGGVDAENEASLRFHERLGFERVAYMREVGVKFGRFLNLVFLQYWITPPSR
jgi:L-amino acid N-acyltransferase YncA